LDRLSYQFCLSVCLLTIMLEFFISFHQILHATQKCDQFDADFLQEKLEVTSGSAMAEGPRDTLVSRNSATT